MPCHSDYLCWHSSWETSVWLFQGSFLEMLLWRKVGIQNFYLLINVNLIGEINNWPWPNYLWTVSTGLTSKDTWAWCLATFGTESVHHHKWCMLFSHLVWFCLTVQLRLLHSNISCRNLHCPIFMDLIWFGLKLTYFISSFASDFLHKQRKVTQCLLSLSYLDCSLINFGNVSLDYVLSWDLLWNVWFQCAGKKVGR